MPVHPGSWVRLPTTNLCLINHAARASAIADPKTDAESIRTVRTFTIRALQSADGHPQRPLLCCVRMRTDECLARAVGLTLLLASACGTSGDDGDAPADAGASGNAGEASGGASGNGGTAAGSAGRGGSAGSAGSAAGKGGTSNSGGAGASGTAGNAGGGTAGSTGGEAGQADSGGTAGTASGAAGSGGEPPELPAELQWAVVSETDGQTFYGIWGSSADDVYAVGTLGDLYHWTGGEWRYEVTDTGATLTGVWGSGPGDVYVSVNSNVILHSTGDGEWEHDVLDAGLTFDAIWGAGPNDVYAVGNGVHRRVEFGNWEFQAVAASGMWGSSATDLYVVAETAADDNVFHSTGDGNWSPQANTGVYMPSVSGSGPSHVYAAGGDSVYFSDGDGSWTPQLSLPGDIVNAVWAVSASAVYACTQNGLVYRSNGAGAWSEGQPIAEGTARACFCIWGSSEEDIYLCTSRGVFHGN